MASVPGCYRNLVLSLISVPVENEHNGDSTNVLLQREKRRMDMSSDCVPYAKSAALRSGRSFLLQLRCPFLDDNFRWDLLYLSFNRVSSVRANIVRMDVHVPVIENRVNAALGLGPARLNANERLHPH